ncbi:MAG TPA: Mur ligase family protein [Spirochaetota bacterium]|jgi:UDP-N-acetylmuramate--alanine ligase|nr:MAG: UDP-N-acetylmuramate--L-alanine ligase [Spirochaetes bacterium ADurb.Bin133]HNZ28032.1 Mur ligase family protein [Spirochaetota bacterium]HPY88931.1 Mur ligase family protein [Spirochaetota bacterium]
MDIKLLKKVHIVGIGGCASSAVAEYLVRRNIVVTGSEKKERGGLEKLEALGVKIFYGHNKKNVLEYGERPDIVLYSPAVTSLDPNNPELSASRENKIQLSSWQSFIGKYLSGIGKTGITISGSEGKGTTGGILTAILKDTEFDPLSILGAKIKGIANGEDSNIYLGSGSTYILEADEYNRNFFNYSPDINVMINFQYEHPETYKNFEEYKEAFYKYFTNMRGRKTLIFRATDNIVDFAKQYSINKTHKIIWFGEDKRVLSKTTGDKYYIENHKLSENGNYFNISHSDGNIDIHLPFLPGYIVSNAVGALLAAKELGLQIDKIINNIKNFKGMVRRFDVAKTIGTGAIVADYGHSPESINCIVGELRNIYKGKKIHLIFQPHLFSRTYNFFDDFILALKKADKISVVDIYPAREKEEEWKDRVSSEMLYEELKRLGAEVYFVGDRANLYEKLIDKIDPNEATCFIGAGDMDLYYDKLIKNFIQ